MTQHKNGPFGAPSPRPGPTASGGDRPPAVAPPEPAQVPVGVASGDNTGSASQERTRFRQDAARNTHETAKHAEQLENEADQLRRRVAALEAYRPGVRGFRPGPLLTDHIDPGDSKADELAGKVASLERQLARQGELVAENRKLRDSLFRQASRHKAQVDATIRAQNRLARLLAQVLGITQTEALLLRELPQNSEAAP